MEVTDSEFEEEIIRSEKPALVMFAGSWCPVCKRNEPLLEEIKEELGDQLKVKKLNIDKNRKTPSEFNVAGTPTFHLFKEGESKGSKVGSVTKEQLREFVKEHANI